MTNLPPWILEDKAIPVDVTFRAAVIVPAPIPKSDWWAESKLKRNTKQKDPSRDFWNFADEVGWYNATQGRYEEWRTEEHATVREIKRVFQNSWPGPDDEFDTAPQPNRNLSWTQEECIQAACAWLNAPDRGNITQTGYYNWTRRQPEPEQYPSDTSMRKRWRADWLVKALEIVRRRAA